MKTLLLPGLFGSSKVAADQAAAGKHFSSPTSQTFQIPQAIDHRFDPSDPSDPSEHIEPGRLPSSATVSARIVAERFIQDIQRLWSRSVPVVDDLWQPPGE